MRWESKTGRGGKKAEEVGGGEGGGEGRAGRGDRRKFPGSSELGPVLFFKLRLAAIAVGW